nr:immunoglobulin heavy chain junction region [Macaca mulatta]
CARFQSMNSVGATKMGYNWFDVW